VHRKYAAIIGQLNKDIAKLKSDLAAVLVGQTTANEALEEVERKRKSAQLAIDAAKTSSKGCRDQVDLLDGVLKVQKAGKRTCDGDTAKRNAAAQAAGSAVHAQMKTALNAAPFASMPADCLYGKARYLSQHSDVKGDPWEHYNASGKGLGWQWPWAECVDPAIAIEAARIAQQDADAAAAKAARDAADAAAAAAAKALKDAADAAAAAAAKAAADAEGAAQARAIGEMMAGQQRSVSVAVVVEPAPVAVVAAPPPPPPPPPATPPPNAGEPEVVCFQHDNFGGWQSKIGAGHYNYENGANRLRDGDKGRWFWRYGMSSVKIRNVELTAAQKEWNASPNTPKITPGYVKLYSEDMFQGAEKIIDIDGDFPGLSNWNDVTMSIRVVPCGGLPPIKDPSGLYRSVFHDWKADGTENFRPATIAMDITTYSGWMHMGAMSSGLNYIGENGITINGVAYNYKVMEGWYFGRFDAGKMEWSWIGNGWGFNGLHFADRVDLPKIDTVLKGTHCTANRSAVRADNYGGRYVGQFDTFEACRAAAEAHKDFKLAKAIGYHDAGHPNNDWRRACHLITDTNTFIHGTGGDFEHIVCARGPLPPIAGSYIDMTEFVGQKCSMEFDPQTNVGTLVRADGLRLPFGYAGEGNKSGVQFGGNGFGFNYIEGAGDRANRGKFLVFGSGIWWKKM
jgi:hypothetical protein